MRMRIPFRLQFPLTCCLMLAGGSAARAQCYQFSSGNAASLTVNITNLPPPTMAAGSVAYGIFDVTGDSATVTIGQTGYTLLPPSPDFQLPSIIITFSYDPLLGYTHFIMQVDGGTRSAPVTAGISLIGSGNLLPNGLPAVLPPISAWTITGPLAPFIPPPSLTVGQGTLPEFCFYNNLHLGLGHQLQRRFGATLDVAHTGRQEPWRLRL